MAEKPKSRMATDETPIPTHRQDMLDLASVTLKAVSFPAGRAQVAQALADSVAGRACTVEDLTTLISLAYAAHAVAGSGDEAERAQFWIIGQRLLVRAIDAVAVIEGDRVAVPPGRLN